jgi:Mrp family chromosome partitioning ATPase
VDKITKALDLTRAKRNNQTSVSRISASDNASPLAQINTPAIKTFTPDVLTLEKNRILNSASREEIIQPYKVLRTRLMHLMHEKGWQTIMVTSPTKDDGKTTVAINLSISIGNSRKANAVLLDLDMLTPSIHSCYGYEAEAGLDEYFEKGTPLSDILVSPDMEGLAIAPSIKSLHDSSEYLSTSKGADLIKEASTIYGDSVVIADLPPILVSDDAISFIPHVDAVLLVVREGKTNKLDLQRAQEMLVGVNIAGVVINDSLEPATLGYY